MKLCWFITKWCARFSRSGHTVLVETNAGSGSFFEDVDYKEAGAEIVAQQAKVLGMWIWLLKLKNHLI